MFNAAFAQPAIIGELKTVLEDISHDPQLPGEAQASVENGLRLIAQHQQKPEKFKAAMKSAAEKIQAMPTEELIALGQQHIGHLPQVVDVEVREKLVFASRLGGIEAVDERKAEALILANPKAWEIWQESAKFWQAELG
jgi:hypothetical protein